MAAGCLTLTSASLYTSHPNGACIFPRCIAPFCYKPTDLTSPQVPPSCADALHGNSRNWVEPVKRPRHVHVALHAGAVHGPAGTRSCKKSAKTTMMTFLYRRGKAVGLQSGSLEDSLRAKRPPGRTGPIRLTWPARTRLAAELANALHYLHTQRPKAVLHGGVRPSNVLLADDTAARLGDVGLPSLLHEAQSTVQCPRLLPSSPAAPRGWPSHLVAHTLCPTLASCGYPCRQSHGFGLRVAFFLLWIATNTLSP